MRDLLSKLDAIVNETALKDKDDLAAKRKALQDIQMDPNTSKDPELKAELARRKAALEKEAKSKGFAEAIDFDQIRKDAADNVKKSIDKQSDDRIAKMKSGDDDEEPFMAQVGRKIIGGVKGAVKGAARGFSGKEDFEVGDEFGISFSEDFEIATDIVDLAEDGIVIDLDEHALELLSAQGWTFEDGELEEGVAGAQKCWKGYRKVGTRPGTGKNAGKRVNDCEKIGEDSDVDESGLQYYTGKKKYGKDGMAALAAAGRKGASEEELGRIKDKYKKEDTDVPEGKYPFAGATVGHKEGPAGQLKGKDPKGYPKGKLVGGTESIEEGGQRFSLYIDDYDLEEHYDDLEDAIGAVEAYKRDDPKSKFAEYNIRNNTGKVVWSNDAWQESMDEAEYRGKQVPLGKKLPGDVKKSKVYVRKPNGNIVKVNFGDKKMRIKKSNPARRKSFRARHNCKNPGPRWKARYWSCRSW